MRSSGILMHISSLPSPYGIGTLGEEARKFVDFLVKAQQSYWQVLPICPTSYGDSPYQSFSSFAGNPYFIDLEILCQEGLLAQRECQSYGWGGDITKVDYGALYKSRYPLLHKAYARFLEKIPEDYLAFCKEQAGWLEDYALFMALKDAHDGASWSEWEPEIKLRQEEEMESARQVLADEIGFWKMVQYLFYKQWGQLKEYANQRGIRMIGDVPIYVAMDSADVWANPSQFYLDENLDPIDVAGCPPDAFSEDGQLWGNPLFRWDVMEKDGYRWWTKRLEKISKLFDVVRIDHFRGFDSFYAIPYGDKTARNGEWRKGPGIGLFRAVEKKLGKLDIIAEDLGFLTDSVRQMLADSGYPGMKLFQFAFDSREDGDYLPHNYTRNCVVYAGTHDNDTILGWMESAPKDCVAFAKEYLKLDEEEGLNWGVMRGVWASVGDLAIVTMQDLLDLGGNGRMNTPSTLGYNWMWRMEPDAISNKLIGRIRSQMALYGRRRQETDSLEKTQDAILEAELALAKTQDAIAMAESALAKTKEAIAGARAVNGNPLKE
ncbi:MAG: 4-alpha-glucanotransferase [Lachnospiraceae bacterium]|jgi:4-alpha-glucanotransferase|nr:4-alpha-glucanotransferase [Lachnospiraceae bacterium]